MRFSKPVLPLAALSLAALLSLWVASPAMAEVQWSTRAEWGPSVLEPGGEGQLLVYTRNYGSSPSSLEGTKVVDHLPSGVIATAIHSIREGAASTPSCSGVGSATVTCALNGISVPALTDGTAGTDGGAVPRAPAIMIYLRVSPSASGAGTNTVTVSGGGDPTPAVVENQISFGKATEELGVNPSTFTGDVFDEPFPADGTAYRQAGGHPADLRFNIDFNEHLVHSELNPRVGFLQPIERVRTIDVTLPRGLIGNPEAVPKCKPLDFLKTGQDPFEETGCPPDTQVGILDVQLGYGNDSASSATEDGDVNPAFSRVALYNMVPPKGTPIDLGYQIGEFATGHIYASLDASRDYAIRAESPYISQVMPVRNVRVDQWGVPGDPVHDLFRGQQPVINESNGQPDASYPPYGAGFGSPIRPFLTNPFDCGVDNGGSRISIDSWKEPGRLTTPLEAGNHLNVTGCEDQRIRFHPAVSLQPTSRAGGGPTGLKVDLEVPQRNQTVENAEELYSQSGSLHGIDTPPIKRAVITFPEGMTLSTSAAQGLTGCTPEEIGLGTNDPVTCPDSSQYGELTIHTPLLPKDEPMRGYIYIAQQSHNPFGTFLAMYFVIEDQFRGLRLKIPGRLDLDPKTGQIVTTFDELPQFPISDMQLSIKGGVRAGLVNPPTCGTKTIKAEFFSWADPTTPIVREGSYDITAKPNGSPCVNSLAERPFAPEMAAGTVSNSAGSYSPFGFRLTRTDEDQEFSQLGVALPPGVTAKLAGIAQCPEAGIAQAISRTGAGDGALEEADPSCPASSQIGTTEVGTGVGQVITYIGGKAYLAGPYQGAPLSMVVISPILAGPYDLGVIAVREAITLNPETAQVTVKSDPFPQIYQGIPVRIRDIRVMVDRPETTLNPTSCDPMQITANVTGVGGNLESTADDTAANLAARFQAANCALLGFKPRLSLRLSGGTRQGAHPALRAVLKARTGDANIADTQVVLPRSEFLDQGHMRWICTRVLFAAHECPQSSIYGYAVAKSPLLDQPLEGPVYLRSSSHQLPDLVAALRGPAAEPIEVDLDGRIDSVHGRIRNSFEVVPDVPVSKFTLTMQGGAKGLLQNSTDLCAAHPAARVLMRAHNGRRHDFQAPLKTGCGKAHRPHGKAKGHHRG